MWFRIINAALTNWRVLAVCAAFAASFAAGWQANGWRLTSAFGRERLEYEQRIAAGWEAALRAHQKQIAEAAEAERRADEAIKRLRKERDKWQTSYETALKADPDCAAQASQPLRCPV
jgi:hypothetical protein